MLRCKMVCRQWDKITQEWQIVHPVITPVYL